MMRRFLNLNNLQMEAKNYNTKEMNVETSYID